MGLTLDYYDDNPPYRKINFAGAQCATNAQNIAAKYDELEVSYNKKAAEAIYGREPTYTGGFLFRNVVPEAHELVAELFRVGVVPDEVDDRSKHIGIVEQLSIDGIALANAEAVIPIVDDCDSECTDATELESKEAIDCLRPVASLEVVAHLREIEGTTKAPLCSESVDIGAGAHPFGGVGHLLTWGCTTSKAPPAGKDELLRVMEDVKDLSETTVGGTG